MDRTEPPVQVTGMDHVVLVVSDVERSVAWYRDVLGIPTERLDEWRREEVLFPSLRLDPTTLIDLLPGAPDGRNVDHIALTVEDVDLEELAASGRFDVVAGPADLFGARGQGIGLYVRDPDGHVIELRTYA
jgi:catechol 2,3-dioxygenase-like lactoylglutathione lyase family enzyme